MQLWTWHGDVPKNKGCDTTEKNAENFLTSRFILCLENLAIYKSTDPFPSNNWQYFLPLEANCWPTQVVLVCCYQSFVNVISTAKFSLYVFQVLGLWGLSNSPRRRNSLKEKRHTFITKICLISKFTIDRQGIKLLFLDNNLPEWCFSFKFESFEISVDISGQKRVWMETLYSQSTKKN